MDTIHSELTDPSFETLVKFLCIAHSVLNVSSFCLLFYSAIHFIFDVYFHYEFVFVCFNMDSLFGIRLLLLVEGGHSS